MGVGEAGAIFLLITPGAAPAALGEAQVAKVDDAYASYFNPAGLAFLYDPDPAKDDYNFDLGKDNFLLDPSHDNYNYLTNPQGTENNSNYDFGEFFFDYGKDGIPNNLEPGYDENYNQDPNQDDYNPITNIDGTESNGRYDLGENYQDFGIDRTKNAVEFGYSLFGTENNSRVDRREVFYDFGFDQIPSNKEVGYNLNGTEGNKKFDIGEIYDDTGLDGLFSKEESGYDPRTNTDPSGDDYHPENNPKGKEKNGKFEKGEPFLDIGIDGLVDQQEPGFNPDPSGDNKSIENPQGSEGNGKFDDSEQFLDFGSDGIIDSLEKGFDPIYNLDPSGDNYNDNNLNGTEGNKNWDKGEYFFDFGIDGIVNYQEQNWNIDPNGDNLLLDPHGDDYDAVINPFGTEGNNQFDIGELFDDFGNDGYKDGSDEEWGFPRIMYNPNGEEGNHKYDIGEKFKDFGNDRIPDYQELGYNPDPVNDDYHQVKNPSGTEGNNLRDEFEEFIDEKVRIAQFTLTFKDSLFHYYTSSTKNNEFQYDDFLAKNVKYNSIQSKINNVENSISLTVFLKDSYRNKKIEKVVAKNLEYNDFNGTFKDSLNGEWDWIDTDNNGTFNWWDVGIDGMPDSLETGYDLITNPDPAGDNYSKTNKRGTEKNRLWNTGEGDWHEQFNDYGNDKISNTRYRIWRKLLS